MRILVVGAGRHVGRQLAPALANQDVRASTRDGRGGTLALDVANAGALLAAVREIRPEAIVNAAADAYTSSAASASPRRRDA